MFECKKLKLIFYQLLLNSICEKNENNQKLEFFKLNL